MSISHLQKGCVSQETVKLSSLILLIILAGLPPATQYGGTSFVTTAPIPITLPVPIVTPGAIFTFEAIQTLSSMTTGF